MRIVLDVSTSFAWGRPPVGIVRTEQKFATFLLDQAHVDVAFSRFDREARCYREVPASVVRRLISSSVSQLSPAEPEECGADAAALVAPAAGSGVDRRVRVATVSAVRRGIAALPGGSQSDATLVVQSAVGLVKGLYWLSLRFGRAVLRRPPRGRGTPIEVEERGGDGVDAMLLGPDDVYVSMG